MMAIQAGSRQLDVLVVEDHPQVAHLVQRSLTEAGYHVDVAYDGPEGLSKIQQALPDLIVLDVLLPGLDGIAVCQSLREQKIRTPVLMLTARDAIPDRVRGLDAGADDYLTKPFALEELLARLRALARRRHIGVVEADRTLNVGDLSLDLDSHEAKRGDRQIELTAKEFLLLSYLMHNSSMILTKSQIIEHVWGYDAEPASNVVEMYVHYLRDKIDAGFAKPLIRTVRGSGYMIRS